MKKVILSAVMMLALAGGSVFAASTQNKNMAGKTKPAATAKKGKAKHKRHGKAKTKTTKNKNM
jgi:hypothetical protein